ncbi:MAG: PAS domain S-box protein, partial [Balneolaceae bacterium]|nr:PAS domain S-box protein [Balneolaceae bacterium]
PFLKEERNLLKSIVDNLALKINRILTQKELQEKQDLLEKAYDLAQIGNWEIDLINSQIYWSSKTKEIHEVPEDFIPDMETGINFYKEGKDREAIRRIVNRAIENGEPCDVELRIITAQNNEKWVRVIGEPEFKNGKCVRIIGSIQDIDKRKRAEEEIVKREQRFKSLVHDGADIIAIIDADGYYQYVAPTKDRVQKMGREPREFYGKSIYDVLHPDYHDLLKESILSIGPGESVNIEPFQYKSKNGEWRWLESTITNLTHNPAIEGYVANSRDVTDRIEQEKKLRDIIENSTNLFYQHEVDNDKNFKFTFISPQSKEFVGCDPDEAKKRWNDFITDHPVNEKSYQISLKAIQTGETQEPYEMQLQNVNGDIIWVEVNEAPVVENGKTVAMVGSLTDITERKETLEKLMETEQKLREIVEHSTNLFFKHDTNHQLQYVSPQSYEFVGLTPEETMNKWTDLVTDHPANEIGFKKTMKAIETGEPQGAYELQFKHADGGKVWARVHEAPIVENGKTVAIVGSLTDITEEKKYEEKLEELSQIAAKTTDLIFIADANHRISWVNTAFEETTGYTLEESVGKMPSEVFFNAEDNRSTLQRINKKMEKRETVKETIQIETKFGEKKWMDITIDSIYDEEKDSTRFITIQKDVTEKIEKEKALKESLERYDIVTKATSDTIWDADLEADTVNYNSNIYDVFGYNVTDVENSSDWWLSKVHPDDRERVDEKFRLAELAKKDRIQIEYRFQCADESYKYINDRAYIISDEDGNPVRMIGAMQDITKQKQENMWLELMESAIANTNEAIAILNAKTDLSPHREVLYVNNAFEKMTGFKREEILGESLLQLMGKETDPNAILKVLKSLDRGEDCQIESTYQSKSGEENWAQISFAPVRDSDGKFSHWICIGRDITNRRLREQALRESLQEKETLLMEIHHRVKNNLAVVSSMMQLQAMDETDESIQKKLFDSVARIRTMVTIHELLYESGSFSKLDFSENIRKLVSMILETIQNGKEIKVNFHCEKIQLNVNQAIPSSLIVNEIVTNCLKHAFEGMSNGQIDIELRERENQIYIKISDNGTGLPENFDMYDTSSLGIQLISVLSKQMNAEYDYYSPSEGGTTFEINFEKSAIKGIGNVYLS